MDSARAETTICWTATDNNDIAFTGVAQPFNIADAVEQVAVQTGNFGVEFGRAGGGVFNVVTKSGTNQLHGTLLWRYQSQRFNSVSNVDKLLQTPQTVFSRNVYGFTLGGPIRKNRTFFFGAFQQDTNHAGGNIRLTVPNAETVTRLQSLFPANPRLGLYLGFLGSLRGTAAPINLALGADPRTGVDRGSVQFASAPLPVPAITDDAQWLIRMDHHRSEAHRFSARYTRDSRLEDPLTGGVQGVYFPGFILDRVFTNQNFLFADSFTFGPAYTNEFRFSYGSQDAEQNGLSPLSVRWRPHCRGTGLPTFLPRVSSGPTSPSGTSATSCFRRHRRGSAGVIRCVMASSFSGNGTRNAPRRTRKAQSSG